MKDHVYLGAESLNDAVLRCGGWGLTQRMFRSIVIQLRMGRFKRVADDAPSAAEFL